jgi:hypothetical protein
MIEALIIWAIVPFAITGLYIVRIEYNTRHR